MTAPCTSPVSWLRLEQLALDRLDAGDQARAHVDGCPLCRSCLEQIRRDSVVLPALPALPVPSPQAGWRRWLRGWQLPTGALAMAAALLLWLVVRSPDNGVDDDAIAARVTVKGGGALVLSLVRDRGGAIDLDPRTVAEGDRWKLRVTCDRPLDLDAEIVVYQRGTASFPLPAQRLTCGNEVTLPGAFAITDVDGSGATICLAPGDDGDDGPPDRAALARGPTAAMACRALAAW